MNPRNNTVIACPNLSLDRTMRVEGLALGRVHRSARSDTRGGGKGVNVARALRHMEWDSLVIGLAGGRTGEAVVGLLQDEGLAHIAVDSPGETRSCLSIVSNSSLTVFNESSSSTAPRGVLRKSRRHPHLIQLLTSPSQTPDTMSS